MSPPRVLDGPTAPDKILWAKDLFKVFFEEFIRQVNSNLKSSIFINYLLISTPKF